MSFYNNLSRITSRKTIFYDNFVSFWTRHSKHIASTWTCHSKHSCHIGPFPCHIGHFLSFWTISQKTMFSTSESIVFTNIHHQEYGIVMNLAVKPVGMMEGLCMVGVVLDPYNPSYVSKENGFLC